MSAVWIMNLRDNRGENANKDVGEKFSICREHNILAIGWENSDPEDDPNYKTALKNLTEMCRGDLVWARDPSTVKQYLCEVLDDSVKEFSNRCFRSKDIIKYRICEYYEISALLDEIDKKQLIARRTIQAVNNTELIGATQRQFAAAAKADKSC